MKYVLWKDSAGSWRIAVNDSNTEFGYWLSRPTVAKVRRAIRQYEKLSKIVTVGR
jgi:hypothetical protein